ncbi:serine/threonine-protein kinase, partial [Gemmatimonadota bacterium]
MDDWSYCPRCGSKLGSDETACGGCGAAKPSASTVKSGELTSGTEQVLLDDLFAELRDALAPTLQLLRQIGQGGMGTVFLARDPALKREVVVKVLSPEFADDPTARARFAREAESAAAVAHPNIISVFQVGDLPRSGTSYFVMQFVDGPTLAKEFPEGTVVPEARAKRIIGEVASALASAHSRGLVHRDIKPSNIMIDRESGRAIVLDFGISAAITPEVAAKSTKLTAQGMSVGTPAYMSPEQAAGEEVTHKSDIYSLGVVAFELLTGRAPFEETNPMALLAAHINRTPPKVTTLHSELAPQLAGLIDRALAKEGEARPSADEIARALVPAPQPLIEWPPPGLERLCTNSRRFLRALRTTALLLLGIFLLFGFQPNSLTPQWYGEQDQLFWSFVSFWAGLASGYEASSGQVWLFLLVLCWFLFAWRATILTVRGWTFASTIKWAKRSGYPWPVLADVVVDTGEETRLVLNRSGLYGSLSGQERDRFITLRRRAGLSDLFGSGFGMIASGLWLLGYIGGFASHGSRFLPFVELLAVIGPSIVLFALAFVCRLPERRYRRRMFHRRRKAKALVRGELVDAWLESVGRVPRTRASRLVAFLVARTSTLGFSVLAFVLFVVYFMLLVTVLGVHNQPASTQRDAVNWMRKQQNGTLLEVTWPEVDSTVGLSTLRRGENDPELFRQLTLVALEGNIGDTVPLEIHPAWNIDTVGTDRFAQHPRVLSDTLVISLWKSVGDRLTDTIVAALMEDTTTLRLALFRGASVSIPPPLWQLREGFPDLNATSVWLLPMEQVRRWRTGITDLAIRNEEAALLQLAAGNATSAERRAREIISLGHVLLRQPVLWFSLFGKGLVDRGARVLTHIGEARRDAALITEGTRLQELFDSDSDDPLSHWSGWWRNIDSQYSWRIGRMLFADPADPPGLA